MEHSVFLDESGDLGWTLNRPFRQDGSSQYFTIAFVVLPNGHIKYIKRLVKNFFKAQGITSEYKGAKFSKKRSKIMANRINNDLLSTYDPFIRVGAITARKANTPPQIIETKDNVLLYNHMMQEAICSHLTEKEYVTITPDERSVPTGSKNSCFDLIKHEIWLRNESSAMLSYREGISRNSELLMFIDWIANFVWRHYEDGQSDAYNVLTKFLEEKRLFF